MVIDKKDMDFLYAHIATWEEFGRKIWEAMSVRMIDQILNFKPYLPKNDIWNL